MSLAEEETEVYTAFSRSVATAINYFSLFSITLMAASETAVFTFGEGTRETIPLERGIQLRDYRKAVLKELKSGDLTNPSLIQRRMYWWMSKIVEWSIVPHSHWYKVMNFYQMSVWELEEK